MSTSSNRLLAPVLVVLAAVVLSACGGDRVSDATPAAADAASEAAQDATPSKPAQEPEPGAEPDPAADLPVEDLAGELVMTKLDGQVATEQELEAIRSLELGGIILFGWNVADEQQLRALARSLDQARAPRARELGLPPGVLVSVDQEGGPIRNVPFAPPERTQPAIAAAGPPESAEQEGVATGRALRAAGVTMDLGPVADLAQQPNRTMAGRSFGDDPRQVAPYVRHTVAGLQRGGVSAVAKHFPGFGASTANSDEAIAHVDRTREQLLAEELEPFRAAVDADVDAIMVSHGIHRGMGRTLPGTLDPAIATGLLRDELGYEGVAMTDSMNARGLREAWGDTVPRACPVAVAAGIDLVLLTGTLETARLCRDRIIEAVRTGKLPEARFREAARRVLDLRARRSGSLQP